MPEVAFGQLRAARVRAARGVASRAAVPAEDGQAGAQCGQCLRRCCCDCPTWL
jgi:hypothetical protein